MDLPKSYIEQIAEQHEMVVISDDRLYLVRPAPAQVSDKNFVRFNTSKGPVLTQLIEQERLSVYEADSLENHNEEYAQWMDQYLKNPDIQNLTRKDLVDAQSELNNLRFIVEDLMPKFLNTSDEGVVDKLQKKLKRSTSQIYEKKAQEYAATQQRDGVIGSTGGIVSSGSIAKWLRQLKQDTPVPDVPSVEKSNDYPKPKPEYRPDKSSFFKQKSYAPNDLLIIKGKVFSLTEATESFLGEAVKIGDTLYKIEPTQKYLKCYLDHYNKARTEQLKEQAIENVGDDGHIKLQIQALREKERKYKIELERILDITYTEKIETYFKKGKELRRPTGHYTFSTRTGENIQKDQQGNYYHFDSLTIKLEFTLNNGKLVYCGIPYVSEKASHMFLKELDKANQPICTDNYNNVYTGAAKISDLITVAKSIMVSGYLIGKDREQKKGKFLPWNRFASGQFMSRQITSDRLRHLLRKGVPVGNIDSNEERKLCKRLKV